MKENSSGNGLLWSDLNDKNKFKRTLHMFILLIIITFVFLLIPEIRNETNMPVFTVITWGISIYQLNWTYKKWKKRSISYDKSA